MSLNSYHLRKRLPRSHRHISRLEQTVPPPATLADLRPGDSVASLGFSHLIPPERLSHLQSYGLLPDSHVIVLQNWPVIVVEVEHTELAIENDLARQILIRGDSSAGL